MAVGIGDRMKSSVARFDKPTPLGAPLTYQLLSRDDEARSAQADRLTRAYLIRHRSESLSVIQPSYRVKFKVKAGYLRVSLITGDEGTSNSTQSCSSVIDSYKRLSKPSCLISITI